MGGFKLTNLAAPTSDSDAARKVDVDAASAGMLPKEPVNVATTGNIADLAAGAPDTVDGVAVQAGDRVLVWQQTTQTENGIYVVDTVGTGSNGAWSRAADFDDVPSTEVQAGNSVYVDQGTLYNTTVFRLSGTGDLVVDTDDLVFVIYSRAEAIIAGNGLDKTGNTLSVNTDGQGIEISGDNLIIELDGSTLSKSASGLRVATQTASRALVSDGSGDIAVSDTTSTEIGHVSGVTSPIQTQLNSKLENIAEDTTPQLGGNLDVSGFSVEDPDADLVLAGQNSIKRAKQASKTSFIEEEYIHSISLAASQTDTTIAALTFAHATYEGMEITFKIKEATSGDVEIGTIRIVTNGTSVAINTVSVETASTGITFDAAVNGANINITYSSGANAATMRADVKKILS
jgi:hypothetical protein